EAARVELLERVRRDERARGARRDRPREGQRLQGFERVVGQVLHERGDAAGERRGPHVRARDPRPVDERQPPAAARVHRERGDEARQAPGRGVEPADGRRVDRPGQQVGEERLRVHVAERGDLQLDAGRTSVASRYGSRSREGWGREALSTANRARACAATSAPELARSRSSASSTTTSVRAGRTAPSIAATAPATADGAVRSARDGRPATASASSGRSRSAATPWTRRTVHSSSRSVRHTSASTVVRPEPAGPTRSTLRPARRWSTASAWTSRWSERGVLIASVWATSCGGAPARPSAAGALSPARRRAVLGAAA